MKVAFPYMGNLQIGIQSCLKKLGVSYLEQKPITKQTLELGVKYSPEFSCFPFKVNIGGFIEALEEGADTLLFAGGFGPCRFGYYGQTQAEILQRLGYKFDYLIIEMVQKNQKDFFRKLSSLSGQKNLLQVFQAVYLGYYKIKILDEAQKLAYYYRPREANHGVTDTVIEYIKAQVHEANNIFTLKQLWQELSAFFSSINIDSRRTIIPVALIGEIYTLLEPKINLNLEKKLGKMGLEIHKSIFLSDWIKYHIFLDAVGYDYKRHFAKESARYLNREIGGHTRENLGKAVQFI